MIFITFNPEYCHRSIIYRSLHLRNGYGLHNYYKTSVYEGLLSMMKICRSEVEAHLERTKLLRPETISEADIEHLPPIVKKYLYYTGVIGKEKIVNVRIEFSGKIRFKQDDNWMSFSSEQYNFFDQPTRIFQINSARWGIPVVGIHIYKRERATMTIKIAGLFNIINAKGPEMDQGETVTIFNDMCLMAPATLLSKNIQWEEVDNLSVNARYTNGNITIGATLLFNEQGELKKFTSNDRFEAIGRKSFRRTPWSTPITGYRNLNGMNIVSSASTVFHRENLDFIYGQFILNNLEFNCKEMK